MVLLRVKWTEACKCQSNPSSTGEWHASTSKNVLKMRWNQRLSGSMTGLTGFRIFRVKETQLPFKREVIGFSTQAPSSFLVSRFGYPQSTVVQKFYPSYGKSTGTSNRWVWSTFSSHSKQRCWLTSATLRIFPSEKFRYAGNWTQGSWELNPGQRVGKQVC